MGKMDEEIRHIFKKAGKQSPSEQFTQNIMKQIKLESIPAKYKPVISGKAWGVIAVVFTAFIFFAIQMPATSSSSFDFLKFQNIFDTAFVSQVNSLLAQFFHKISVWMLGSKVFIPVIALIGIITIHLVIFIQKINSGNKQTTQLNFIW